MQRRKFLKLAAKSGIVIYGMGIAGCGREESITPSDSTRPLTASRVILYDTYAMALYFDGELGPQTGIVKVDYIKANQPVTLQFWHGHGGVNHRYTLTPQHFLELRRLKKIYVETTSVDSHTHKLFIDPKDPKWRVPGAVPVEVPDPTDAA